MIRPDASSCRALLTKGLPLQCQPFFRAALPVSRQRGSTKIVIAKNTVCSGDPLSLASRVAEKAPTAVGVPAIITEFSPNSISMPGGKAPEVTSSPYSCSPPLIVQVTENPTLTVCVPGGKQLNSSGVAMKPPNSWLVEKRESLTVIVKSYSLESVGVPLTVTLLAVIEVTLIPGGKPDAENIFGPTLFRRRSKSSKGGPGDAGPHIWHTG